MYPLFQPCSFEKLLPETENLLWVAFRNDPPAGGTPLIPISRDFWVACPERSRRIYFEPARTPADHTKKMNKAMVKK